MKTFIIKLVTVLCLLLGIFTMTSYRIEILMLPKINSENIKIEEIETEGKLIQRELLPIDALLENENGSTVIYSVQMVDGVWGKEYVVHEKTIGNIEYYHEGYFSAPEIQGSDAYASRPTRQLIDWERVTLH